MRSRLAAATVLAVGSVAPLDAQVPALLSATDSAQLYVASLHILLDSLAPHTLPEVRVWIRLRAVPPDTAPGRELHLSDAQWSEITRAFPAARHAAATDSVFLCPPGVRVRMPGSGCPIRDGGIVVQFGSLRVDADSASVFGMLIQSGSSAGRPSTWAQGMLLVFERAGAAWRLRATRGRFITQALCPAQEPAMRSPTASIPVSRDSVACTPTDRAIVLLSRATAHDHTRAP